MNTKDLNGPASEEQSGNEEKDTGNTENKANMKKQRAPEEFEEKSNSGSGNDRPETGQPGGEPFPPETMADNTGTKQDDPNADSTADMPDQTGAPAGKPRERAEKTETETGKSETESRETETETGKSETETVETETETGKSETETVETETETIPDSAGVVSAGLPEDPDGIGTEKENSASETWNEKAESIRSESKPGADNLKHGIKTDTALAEYHNLDKGELLNKLEKILESRSVPGIREDVEAIKVSFYKSHKAEVEQKRKRFMQEGGDAEAFEPGSDAMEERFKELYRKYRHSKAAHNRSLEHTRHSNLEAKLKVIEDLKELVKNAEDINQTFPEFRKLQKRWHETGMVPQQNLKDLWDTYHHYVETFYDHIKIDKELRDLDLKKNLEAKIELCEKAEELLLEPNVINAFRKLQKLHDQWRETGPVPRDQKDTIWERFREVTHQINKKHQEHFDKLKEAHKKNLETKSAICEKAEIINQIPFENLQQVEKLTKEMVDIQRTWKTIGFAPKKDNARIYQRFRNVCDRFFARKREFNAQNKDYLAENLQKKLELCIQAESLKESSDWRKTTDELISLQKKWKEVGPVPRKHYDTVWKRFRAACDTFFTRKAEFFSTMDSKYEENLNKKLELIEKIENLKVGNDPDTDLNILKEYQREWVSIGFVPIKQKDAIQKKYRAALDKHFEGLKIDESKKNLMKFRHKLEGVKEKPRALNKMKFDREKFLNRYRHLENDITLWENNIGFFAKSKSSEATIKEFMEKIEEGKKQMALLEEKIRMIDEMDPD